MRALIIELILLFVVLTNLTLLGSSRLHTPIQLSAAQGMALGLLPLLVAEHGIGVRPVLIAVVIFVLKGIVFPRLLFRALRTADVRHEIEPIVGFAASIMAGIALLATVVLDGVAVPAAAPGGLAAGAAAGALDDPDRPVPDHHAGATR